ncbi:hypothetical protein HDU93_006006 [Gonapodya sp. JEL0774]|nr:hypothetical protein HDU93_006006 [Gonapodya sp. JEL0774]
MSSTRDAQLFTAVENGETQRARQLLMEGANANARKRVKLTRTLPSTNEVKTETVDCESVLALAILHGHVDIVDALLSSGADPNGKIEWKIAGLSSSWSLDKWKRGRWVATYTFPSPLTLAMARGGTRKGYEGVVSDAPKSDNKLPINFKGGEVKLNDANTAEDTRISSFLMKPSLPIVQVLLKHGAVVSTQELSAASKHADSRFSQTLLQHKNGPSPSVQPQTSGLAPLVSSPSSQSVDTFLSLLSDKDRKVDELLAQMDRMRAQIEELSVRTAVSESKAGDLEKRNGELVAQNTALKSANQDLQVKTRSLSLAISSKSSIITTLEKELAAARSQPTSLPEAPTRQPQPPYTINKLMYANVDFEARDADELDIATGDGVFVNLGFADGWGSGFNTSRGTSGAFPLACVSERLNQPQPSLPTYDLSSVSIRYDSCVNLQMPPTNPFRPVPTAPPSSSLYTTNHDGSSWPSTYPTDPSSPRSACHPPQEAESRT